MLTLGLQFEWPISLQLLNMLNIRREHMVIGPLQEVGAVFSVLWALLSVLNFFSPLVQLVEGLKN